MDSASKKTITLGRVLAGNLVGLLFGGAWLYLTGTSHQIVLVTCVLLFVVFNLYILFAFNVWGEDNEATAGVQKRSPLKKRLSLTFWGITFGGAVLFICFWLFGFIYSLAHSRHALFGALLPAALGVLLAGAALRMFLEEKSAS